MVNIVIFSFVLSQRTVRTISPDLLKGSVYPSHFDNCFRIRTSKKSARNPNGIRTYKTQDLNLFKIRTYKKWRGRGTSLPALYSRSAQLPTNLSSAEFSIEVRLNAARRCSNYFLT